MKFRYSILYVDNVNDTLTFYKNAFGFEIGYFQEGGDYGELVTGNTKLCFSAKSLMRELGKAPGDASSNSPIFELAFESDDVDGDFAKAVIAGATPVSEPHNQPWGQRISYVTDPNEFLIEICSPVAG